MTAIHIAKIKNIINKIPNDLIVEDILIFPEHIELKISGIEKDKGWKEVLYSPNGIMQPSVIDKNLTIEGLTNRTALESNPSPDLIDHTNTLESNNNDSDKVPGPLEGNLKPDIGLDEYITNYFTWKHDSWVSNLTNQRYNIQTIEEMYKDYTLFMKT